MANLNLQNGNKWDAASVFDAAQNKGQAEINARAEAIAALGAAANNGKFLGVVNGAIAAVSLEAWTGGSY
jgi:hypothetical protein